MTLTTDHPHLRDVETPRSDADGSSVGGRHPLVEGGLQGPEKGDQVVGVVGRGQPSIVSVERHSD